MNSPAFKAGIRPGDIIEKVDGKNCDGLTTTQVADLLKGAKGTTVHISLGREGWDKPIEVTVVRDGNSLPWRRVLRDGEARTSDTCMSRLLTKPPTATSRMR